MKKAKLPLINVYLKDRWMQIITWILLVILIIPVTLKAAEADRQRAFIKQYSLEELYRLGLERSEEIQMARNQLFVAEKDVDWAFSVIMPKLSGFGDYIRYNKSGAIQPESGYSYGAKLHQEFTINGRELIALQAAKDITVQREYDMRAVMESILYSVSQSYFDIVNKQNQVDIDHANVKRLETHRDAVLKKMALEEAPKTDLLRTEAELSGARSDMVRSENALIFAFATLARLLALPEGYKIAPPDKDHRGMEEATLNNLIANALAHRYEIKSLEQAQILAQQKVDIARGDYWPKFTWEAGYKGQGADPSQYAVDETLYGAASLNMTLFDWGTRGAILSQEKAAQRNAKLQLQIQSRQVALEVEQAYLTLVTAKRVIQAVRDKLKFSKTSFDAVSLQFKLGQADILDVMDANTILFNAEQELSDALYYYSLSQVGLKRAQGILLDEVRNELGMASE
jgi:outer membrane protein